MSRILYCDETRSSTTKLSGIDSSKMILPERLLIILMFILLRAIECEMSTPVLSLGVNLSMIADGIIPFRCILSLLTLSYDIADFF